MMPGAAAGEEDYGVFSQGSHGGDQMLRGGLGPNALDLFPSQQGGRVQGQGQQGASSLQGLQGPSGTLGNPALAYTGGLSGTSIPGMGGQLGPSNRGGGLESGRGGMSTLNSAATASDRKTPPGQGYASSAAPTEKQVCTFFMRTGTCAYGERCKFSHPQDRPPPQLNSRGYPLRPEEIDCAHYMKKGWCAFGLTCKFNHPEIAPVVNPFSLSPTQGSFVGLPTAQAYAPAAGVYAMPSAVPTMPTVYYVPAQLPPTQLTASALNPNSLSAFQASAGGGATGAGGYPGLSHQAAVASSGVYRQAMPQSAAAYGSSMLPMHVLSEQHAGLVGMGQPRADQLQAAMNNLRLRDK